MSQILVVAEHNGKVLSPNFQKVMGAVKVLGPATVVVAGHGVKALVQAAGAVEGVAEVLCIDDPLFERPTPELWVENLAPLAAGKSHIVAPSGTYGRGMLGRLAARLGVPMLSDVVAVAGPTVFSRPIYAGAVVAEVVVEPGEAPIVLSVRASSFQAAGSQAPALVKAQKALPAKILNESIGLEVAGGARPELGTASVVVSGGRGVGTKEDFALIEQLADVFGGAVGASRAAVDAGFAPNDWQVGQTGKVVAPDVYFAIGISGAVQHLAGIKGAKIIVAINKDPNAPIFSVADYGLVGDLFAIVPALIKKLQ